MEINNEIYKISWENNIEVDILEPYRESREIKVILTASQINTYINEIMGKFYENNRDFNGKINIVITKDITKSSFTCDNCDKKELEMANFNCFSSFIKVNDNGGICFEDSMLVVNINQNCYKTHVDSEFRRFKVGMDIELKKFTVKNENKIKALAF